MKHVFFAHSHTLTLCSLGTIEYLHLDHNDCIFLCTRNYVMPEGLTDCKTIDANLIFDEFNKNLSNSLFQNWKDIKRFDKNLDMWTEGSEYNLYTPHLYGGIYILIASYKKCRKVSFVQEGAYTVPGKFINNLSWFQKLKCWISSLINYGSFRVYACKGWYTDGCLPWQHKIDIFATSQTFFQYMPQHKCIFHKISWPICKFNLHKKSIDAPIFVFDGFVKNGIVDEVVYLRACKRIIDENIKESNYVKFHPAQSLEERCLIMSFFDDLGVKVDVFSEEIPFEFYITNCEKMTIVGFSSSLLFFAKDAGHNVIARSSWLLESPVYRAEVEKGYPVFDNKSV